MSTSDFLPFTRPTIDEATIAAVADVLRSGWLTTGPKCAAFEKALSERFGGRPVRVFNSGTITLEIALQLAGVGPGDEVITTPLSWVATANVVLHVGARPVFVDIDPVTRNLDLSRVAAAITPRTRAIIPVDLAGLPVPRDALYRLARQHGLRVIEDAAQSFGASWQGTPIGESGDFVSFSFHANKNMTTGEGGALVLPPDVDVGLCERLRLQGVQRFADGGMDVGVAGHKGNMTDIAAVIGLHQMERIEAFTARRRELARRYLERLAGSVFALPVADFENCNWHMFQVLLPDAPEAGQRGRLVTRMRELGFGIGVHYPAMHLFSLFRELGYGEGDFPVAESVGRRTITLPLFPAMLDEDVDRVCAALAACIQELYQ
ncbi:MAG: DegT/DnrJ/EryC1/StrS aminotransferase family protein [Rhodocyclaceae bacterium]|nr:DegT/DnrJ/EryC1/StrS aminotransferase family protein [Rhodocyclaceae bacterium]